MFRNLKVLLAAAMALAAFGVLGASGAQAAEFHCSVEPCRVTLKPDEAAKTKTAHHVFEVTQVVEGKTISAATTCNTLDGEGTATTKTVKELTITKLEYTECNVVGNPSVVRTNECDYLFKIATAPEGTVTVTCPTGKAIEIEVVETGCLFKIGSQGPLNGIKYHNHAGLKELMTVETNVTGIAGTVANGKCKSLGFNEAAMKGNYTTGNTLVTGETDPGGVMANVWFE